MAKFIQVPRDDVKCLLTHIMVSQIIERELDSERLEYKSDMLGGGKCRFTLLFEETPIYTITTSDTLELEKWFDVSVLEGWSKASETLKGKIDKKTRQARNAVNRGNVIANFIELNK